ncbi:hypothetical protein [Kordiimonas aestuarii]|uniref:hypothetical protein n=1 Tax=Kordiimonas aestuarii TaxID=1005925 RepID=UPI0021D1137E|nr:hypothetical protein [Kordiimonas aestuarii]
MSIGRFVLSVSVLFIIYLALYVMSMGVIFADIFTANADIIRSPGDRLMPFQMLGHLLQTSVVVLLFNLFVASSSIKVGARFGLLIGCFLAATHLSVYTGLDVDISPLPYAIVIHLFIGAVVGMVLAKLYKPQGDGA